MEKTIDNLKYCREGADAPCTASCPFHLDIPGFATKIARGNDLSAYRDFRAAVGFPKTVTRFCDRPCESSCTLQDMKDVSVRINLLENQVIEVIESCSGIEDVRYRLPAKNKSVLVLGGGAAGIACALRLLEKNYEVKIVEQSGALGGYLRDGADAEESLIEMDSVLGKYPCEVILNEHIPLDTLSGTGAGAGAGAGAGMGASGGGKICADAIFVSFSHDEEFSLFPNIFSRNPSAGACSKNRIIRDLAAGYEAASEIEYFLGSGSIRSGTDKSKSPKTIYMDPQLALHHVAAAGADSPPANADDMKDDMKAEADRCLCCSCSACVSQCDMMAWYKKFPRRIADEVSVTVNQKNVDGSDVNIATQLIASCSQCGLCGDVCGEGIDLSAFLLESRSIMHRNGRMPWAYHAFWINDMLHANSEASALFVRPADAPDSGRGMLFFPGCQMGASDPDYVVQAFDFLRSKYTNTGISLYCCGAPALWAGDTDLHEEVLNAIRQQWNDAGRPEAVLACPNCRKLFDRYLPEIKTSFIYDHMLIHDRMLMSGKQGGGRFHIPFPPDAGFGVFDPCASRAYPELQTNIRELLLASGATLAALPHEREYAKCCGYGGGIAIANPELADKIADRNCNQKDVPYVTYCTNCKDIMASRGKEIYHIFDLLFGSGCYRTLPTFSERQRNRELLKSRMAGTGHEQAENISAPDGLRRLAISDSLKQKLHREYILENDVMAVLESCEGAKTYIEDRATGIRYGSLKIGHMTYWIEYAPGANEANEADESNEADSPNAFLLTNAYSHRISLGPEQEKR